MAEDQKYDFSDFDEAPEQEYDFSDFEDSSVKTSGPEPMSRAEAAMQAGTQGMTFGFGDEIAGGFEAAGQAVGLEGLGGPIADIGLSEAGPTLDPEALLKAYREGREAQRGRVAEAEETYPVMSTAADVAGGFTTPVGALKTIKDLPKLKKLYDAFTAGSKVKAGAKIGAGLGALEAAGRSEADLTEGEAGELITDVAGGTALGAGAGAVAGKIAQKMEPEEIAKTAKELSDSADEQAMKALGADRKAFEEQLEKETKARVYGREKVRSPGEFALEKEILDPLEQPKKTYENVLNLKKRVSGNYETEINRFQDAVDISDSQATELADRAFRKMDEKVAEELRGNDTIPPEMREKLSQKASELQEELAQALQDRNPIRALQDIYVRYNKEAFKNAKNLSPTTEARKILRNEIKTLQRELVDTLDAESAKRFKELDADYTDLLHLEEFTLNAAAKGMSGSKLGAMSDLARGATAKFIGIPGLGELITAAGVATRKGIGKDISDVAAGASAIVKKKRAKKLEKLLEDYRSGKKTPAEMSGEEAAAKVVIPGSAIETSEPNDKYTPAKERTKRVEQATPDELDDQARTIRETYGKDGEKLAMTLEKMKEKDSMGRKALMFSLMQDPAYREMLKG